MINTTLIKKELREQFVHGRKNKFDILNTIFSLVITVLIAVVFIFVFFNIAETYINLKINDVADKTARATELMGVAYLGVFIVNIILATSKLYQTLSKPDKALLMMPVDHVAIFISKMVATMVYVVVFMSSIILPINIIFAITAGSDLLFWVFTLIICLLMPTISMAIGAILVVPVMKIVRFIKTKYILIAISFTALLSLGFYVYSYLLDIFKSLIQVGSIRYIFSENTISVLQTISGIFPSCYFAQIMYSTNVILPLLVLLGVGVASAAIAYFIIRFTFFKLLFASSEYKKTIKTKIKKQRPLVSLLKTEFINVYRVPNNIFQCFSLALSIPLIIYCCITLFDKLVASTIGMNFSFEIALFSILVFSVLMNSFSTTNITRDGKSILFMKAMPCKPELVIWAKVIFSGIVNLISLILSLILIGIAVKLSFLEILLLFLLGFSFTIANILFATKLDLTRTNTNIQNSSTTALFTFIGMIAATAISFVAILLRVVSFEAIKYLVAIFLCAGYFGITFVYYKYKLTNYYQAMC